MYGYAITQAKNTPVYCVRILGKTMNINRPINTDNIRFLPRTAEELARILKAAQPGPGKGSVAGQTFRERCRPVSPDPVPTYTMVGNRPVLNRNLTGVLVDVRA